MQVSSRGSWSKFSLLSSGALVICVVASLLAFASAAGASPGADSYIVVLKDDVAHPANVAHRHEENRGADVDHIYGTAIEGYSAELTPDELKAIKQDPNVDYVERDGSAHTASQQQSTGFRRVFAPGNPNLHIDEIDKEVDRTNVDVAVIDTGVEIHPDLNVFSRTNCIVSASCEAKQVLDGDGHGTHVAGIIGAIDNQIGVVGTAPGARIWSVKAGNADGSFEISDIIAAINWVTARSSQIEVVNMSIECTSGCAVKAWEEAIAASVNKGVVYVVAAGNEANDVSGGKALYWTGSGTQTPYIAEEDVPATYPANFSDVITVSSLNDFDGAPGGVGAFWYCYKADQDDSLAEYSNWGRAVDITAPGSCILSTSKGGGYELKSGTSMASPMVAGAAAGLAAANNPNNRAEVEAIRKFIRALGNYNWTDTHYELKPNGEEPMVSDGVQEPLLQMGDPGQQTQAPSVTTAYASPVTTSTAKLVAWLNPNGAATNFYFQYGTTTAYGNTAPASPGWSAGSGRDPQVVAVDVGNLEPETTYHYRIVATNAKGTSTGEDLTFRTQAMTLGSPSVLLDQSDDQSWVHSRNSNTGALQYANWKASTSWTTTGLGTPIRAGSKPAPLLDNSTKQQWVYFADENGQLKYWNWKTGEGWKEYSLGSTIRQGTSPVAVLDQQTKQQWVYYITPNGQIRYWNWKMENGWKEYSLGSTGAVAYNSSPTVAFDEATKETSLYFVRSEMALGQWRWSGTGWSEGILTSSVRGNSSPTVVFHPGSKQQWVYYIGSDNQIHYYNYNLGSGWAQYGLPASSVAANTGLSAVIDPATYQQWLYYVEPTGNIGYWNWKMENAWKQYSLGASVAPGTTVAPALDLATKQQWVYYRNPSGTISYWNWNAAVGGWKQFP